MKHENATQRIGEAKQMTSQRSTPISTIRALFASSLWRYAILAVGFVVFSAVVSHDVFAQTAAERTRARMALKAPPAPPDVAAAPSDAEETESGLASKVIAPGTGTAQPRPVDTVVVNYTGWTTDGTMFDSTALRGQPSTVSLDAVLPGWTEGLQLMVEGETRRFWVPEELAFRGAEGRPAGTVVFDIELVEIRAALSVPTTPEDLRQPQGARRDSTGLVWKVLRPGTGTTRPTDYSRVMVHYSGWTQDGNMFESSVVRGTPVVFSLAEVMRGWSVGLQQMVEGEIRRLWIPENMAYAGMPGRPSGRLVFDVELIEIVEQ